MLGKDRMRCDMTGQNMEDSFSRRKSSLILPCSSYVEKWCLSCPMIGTFYEERDCMNIKILLI